MTQEQLNKKELTTEKAENWEKTYPEKETDTTSGATDVDEIKITHILFFIKYPSLTLCYPKFSFKLLTYCDVREKLLWPV
jgi:hypothetical protein